MKFVDLLLPGIGSPAKQQIEASKFFPSLVSRSRLHLWSPGDPVESRGVRALLGVSPSYCIYDLILLDDADAAPLTASNEIRIDVFDLAVCHTQSNIQAFFPVAMEFQQTPVLGIWSMGRLIEVLQGYHARERLRLLTSAAPGSHHPPS